jgi:hypothetical protein
MSLDVYLTRVQPSIIFEANITHNLNTMAERAGIYHHLWRPDEIGITKAEQLIGPLTNGLNKLKGDPEHFKRYDSPNGWGTYENLVRFVEKYLAACMDAPDADIEVSR